MALKNVSLETTVLVVDDVLSARVQVKNFLKIMGFTKIEEADNGRAALERILQGGVDLVISDWQMPDMEGIELIKHVRDVPQLTDLPFIMVTAQSGNIPVVHAALEGVSGYLNKPITIEQLEGEIDAVFQEIQENQQAADQQE